MRRAAVAACVAVTILAGCHHKKPAAHAPMPPPTPEPTPTPSATATPGPSYYETTIGGTLKETWANLKRQTRPLQDAFSGAIDDISEEDEKALGQASALEIIRGGGGLLVADEPLVQYVNRVGNLVAQHGSRKVKGPNGKIRKRSRDFVFGILDDDNSVNAFSTPGGYVFVTSGLVRDLGSESELAWVLGHEIGHVDLEHNLKALKIYLRERAVGETFGNLTGDSNAHERWSNSTFFQSMAAKSADVSRQMNGKKEEREADLVGLEYSTAAGYDAQGATRVLETLGALSTANPSLFATHDPPLSRRDALAASVAKHKGGKIGASRFTTQCIDRLDAVRSAKAAPVTTPR